MHTLEELMKDDEFMKNIANATTAEEICDLFHQKGVEVTKEDAEAVLKEMAETGEELELDELEDVAGGFAAAIGVACVAISFGALYL